MNLTGGRRVFVANVCALILAIIVMIEDGYIRNHLMGRFLWDDYLICFLPLLIALIVRNATVSYVFLFLYAAISIQLLFEARDVYSGMFKYAGAKDPTGYPTLFFLISLACFACYVMTVLFRILVRLFIRISDVRGLNYGDSALN